MMPTYSPGGAICLKRELPIVYIVWMAGGWQRLTRGAVYYK